VATWVVITASATGLAWLAVSRIGKSSPAALSPSAVEAALRAQPSRSTTTLPPGASDPATPASTTLPTTPPTAVHTTAPVPASPTGTAKPQPPTTSTTTVARTSSVVNSTGGVVSLECEGSDIRLVSSSPNNGFDQDINHAGPSDVDVRFRSSSHESEIRATCEAGRPVAQVEEKSDGG
jgi:hypothetical protein